MAGESPKVKTFSCPACSASLTIRGLGQTSTYACTSCGSIIDISGDSYKLLRKSQQMKYSPVIPVGSRGKFLDDLFEVVGFMVRSDGSGEYEWREYLLFNPYKGFRWLAESDGHWTFYTMIKDKPIRSEYSSSFRYDGALFKHFLSGVAKVKFVLGEFYWEVKIGTAVNVNDFICPPLILSQEQDKEEEIWSCGEYIAPQIVRQAFPECSDLPLRTGIAPNQPFPVESFNFIAGFALFCLTILTVSQFVFVSRMRNQMVTSQSYSFNIADSQKVKASPPFQLSGGTSNVLVQTASDVDNAWLEVDVDLVNASNGESFGATLETAFYHGMDSDGYWSEGSREAKAWISSVPDGTYYLTNEASLDPRLSSMNYRLSLRRDVPYWGNYWVAIFLIILLPLGLAFYRVSFESKRWNEADI